MAATSLAEPPGAEMTRRLLPASLAFAWSVNSSKSARCNGVSPRELEAIAHFHRLRLLRDDDGMALRGIDEGRQPQPVAARWDRYGSQQLPGPRKHQPRRGARLLRARERLSRIFSISDVMEASPAYAVTRR